MKDLSELQEYWKSKYPKVLVTLWESQDRKKYYGMMMTKNQNTELAGNTIAELIVQGELFLMKVTN